VPAYPGCNEKEATKRVSVFYRHAISTQWQMSNDEPLLLSVCYRTSDYDECQIATFSAIIGAHHRLTAGQMTISGSSDSLYKLISLDQ